jgi:hypothetical protein
MAFSPCLEKSLSNAAGRSYVWAGRGELSQRPHLVTANRVHAGNPILDTVNVQAALGQFDLLPLQVTHLRGPQTVAIGDQDHGCVAMPVAAMLSSAVHQPLDLALGEVAALDCQVYDAWCAFLGCRFHAAKPCLRATYCLAFLAQSESTNAAMECIVIAMQDRDAWQQACGTKAAAPVRARCAIPPG